MKFLFCFAAILSPEMGFLVGTAGGFYPLNIPAKEKERDEPFFVRV